MVVSSLLTLAGLNGSRPLRSSSTAPVGTSVTISPTLTSFKTGRAKAVASPFKSVASSSVAPPSKSGANGAAGAAGMVQRALSGGKGATTPSSSRRLSGPSGRRGPDEAGSGAALSSSSFVSATSQVASSPPSAFARFAPGLAGAHGAGVSGGAALGVGGRTQAGPPSGSPSSPQDWAQAAPLATPSSSKPSSNEASKAARIRRLPTSRPALRCLKAPGRFAAPPPWRKQAPYGCSVRLRRDRGSDSRRWCRVC